MRQPAMKKLPVSICGNTNAAWSRRGFISRGLWGGALVCAPQVVRAAVLGGQTSPNNRVGVGLIGRGLMGAGHLARLISDPSFQVLAVCDPDQSRLNQGKEAVETAYATARAAGNYRGCLACKDYRELLASPGLDAVVIATPDHWHALQAMDAARAGKDVYCEKPVSLTIEEGRQIVTVVRRNGRVFQTGTQYRSIPTIRQICQFVREGGLGKVKAAFTILNTLAGFIRGGRFQPWAALLHKEEYLRSFAPIDVALPAEPPPPGLDWDMWVGPAPWTPYHPLYHINPSPGVVPWSFCDAFGGASTTWHLSHSTDVIQYALGMERSGPVEILHPADGHYPTLTCRYASGTRLHFVEHWGQVKSLYKALPDTARLEGLFGGVFVGERGWLTSMSIGGRVEGGPDSIFSELNLPTREVVIGSNNHHANWLEGIRNRRAPSSDEEIGHRSASLCHLALICGRLGRSLKWDPVKEEFPGDEQANRLRARAMREPWRI